jgi:hypothetical protein
MGLGSNQESIFALDSGSLGTRKTGGRGRIHIECSISLGSISLDSGPSAGGEQAAIAENSRRPRRASERRPGRGSTTRGDEE